MISERKICAIKKWSAMKLGNMWMFKVKCKKKIKHWKHLISEAQKICLKDKATIADGHV